MSDKKVKFIPGYKEAALFGESPNPASQHVPKWFKDIPLTINREPFKVEKLNTNFTIKLRFYPLN